MGEREALALLLCTNPAYRYGTTPCFGGPCSICGSQADAILAAGWRRSPAPEPWNPATSPGMTDMMVDPGTLDAFMEANPLPATAASAELFPISDAAVIERARAEIERLRDLLGRAGSQFRHYEVLHRQKGADDKAAINEKWATLCERAAQEAGHGR